MNSTWKIVQRATAHRLSRRDYVIFSVRQFYSFSILSRKDVLRLRHCKKSRTFTREI